MVEWPCVKLTTQYVCFCNLQPLSAKSTNKVSMSLSRTTAGAQVIILQCRNAKHFIGFLVGYISHMYIFKRKNTFITTLKQVNVAKTVCKTPLRKFNNAAFISTHMVFLFSLYFVFVSKGCK